MPCKLKKAHRKSDKPFCILFDTKWCYEVPKIFVLLSHHELVLRIIFIIELQIKEHLRYETSKSLNFF